MSKLRRIGEQKKCPAFGWRIDAEAYRCPKCFIYFCYKCRARVTKGDSQYQCADQSCECYGKLLCAACTVMVPEFKDVTRTVVDEPKRTVTEGDNWGWAAFIIPAALGIWLWVKYSFLWGVGGAVASFTLIAIILAWAGSTWFAQEKVIPKKTRKVTENKQVAEHRCCIQCKHPIKDLT